MGQVVNLSERRLPSEGWMEQRLCRTVDPEVFFPRLASKTLLAQAQAVCFECPVREQCLEYAIEHRIDHGIWGGCSERERKRIRRRRVLDGR